MRRHLDFLVGVPLLRILRLFSRRPKARATTLPQRILLIKLAAFGDGIVLIPALRALRQALPLATMDWLITPIIGPVAELVPYVNEVKLLRSFGPFSVWSLCRQLRRERYDIVIDLEQWSRGSALIAWACGAPERLGFTVKGQHRSALFTQTLEKTFTFHERDDFFNLISLAVPLKGSRDLELWEAPSGVEELQVTVPSILEPRRFKKFVLIHPGCGRDGTPREWPIDSYASLTEQVARRADISWLISGGPDDAAKTAELARRIPGSLNLAGRLSWKGIISLVKRIDLLVSGNTGIMHVGAAWHIPQIALHGPTNAAIWGPLNDRAVVITTPCPGCPCLRLGFEYHQSGQTCMAQIPVAQVVESAANLLSAQR